MGLNYTGEAGAFGKYVEEDKTVSGLYMGLTPGLKFWVFDVYVNVGVLKDFYKKEPEYMPANDNNGNNNGISNAKPSSWHFVAAMGLGITLDLFSLNN